MKRSNRIILGCASIVVLMGCPSLALSDPLFVAARQGDTGQVETLLNGGSDPNMRDRDRKTPLLVAIEGGMTAVITESGSLNMTPQPGPGNVDTVRVLLKSGADPDLVDKWGKSAMLLAALYDREQTVAALLAHGVDPNASHKRQPKPLVVAASHGHLGVVMRLLEAGAKADGADEHGQTSLMSASYMGYLKIAGVLLDAGADVNASDTNGHTPLSNATYRGQSEVVRLLIKRGARIDDKDNEGKDALAIAKERGNSQIIEILSAGIVQELVALVPPSFDEQRIEVAGGDDAEILEAIDAAVTVAKNHGYQYDASDSENGRVVVKALWKDRPVTLTMRFFRKEGGLYIASAMEQPGDVALSGGGTKIAQIFYPDLLEETTRRGLSISGDPRATP